MRDEARGKVAAVGMVVDMVVHTVVWRMAAVAVVVVVVVAVLEDAVTSIAAV